MSIIEGALGFFAMFLFFMFSDDYSVEVRDEIFNTVLNNQNVVVISRCYDTKEWENLMDFDITLKNGARMRIEGCKKNKNGKIVYETVDKINDCWLREIFYNDNYYKYWDNEYAICYTMRGAKDVMGNDSLKYLLDNYQKLYDFCMDAPEFDGSSYYEKKKMFDNIPDKFMYDFYDEEIKKLVPARKLYRVRSSCKCGGT